MNVKFLTQGIFGTICVALLTLDSADALISFTPVIGKSQFTPFESVCTGIPEIIGKNISSVEVIPVSDVFCRGDDAPKIYSGKAFVSTWYNSTCGVF